MGKMSDCQHFISSKTISTNQIVKEFIQNSLVYPTLDLAQKNAGDVQYEFTIDENGNTSKYVLIKGLSDEMNKEALRLIKKIQWIAATENGTPVKSTQIFTIVYDIKKYLRQHKNEYESKPKHLNLPIDSTGKVFDIKSLDSKPEPTLNGKISKLSEIINKELIYPEAARSLSIQGTVKLGMVVEDDGIVSNIYVINSIGGGCDNEAIRILQKIIWIPGVHDNQIVRTKSNFEVTFKLNENKQNEIPSQQNSGM